MSTTQSWSTLRIEGGGGGEGGGELELAAVEPLTYKLMQICSYLTMWTEQHVG